MISQNELSREVNITISLPFFLLNWNIQVLFLKILGPLSILRISKCQNEDKGKGCVIFIDELQDHQNKKS